VARATLTKKSAIAAKAKANQQGGQGGVLLAQIFAEAIDTRLEIAAAAGVSHDTVSKVERQY
jgi:DNA-binding XRE family transcriptional regulator